MTIVPTDDSARVFRPGSARVAEPGQGQHVLHHGALITRVPQIAFTPRPRSTIPPPDSRLPRPRSCVTIGTIRRERVMKRCPRCNTSMILEEHNDNDALVTAYARVGKRLGSGREFPCSDQRDDKEEHRSS